MSADYLHDDLIKFPTAKLSVVGLDEHGDEVISEIWESLADQHKPVDMFTRLGIVGMVQQTLTGQALGVIEGEED